MQRVDTGMGTISAGFDGGTMKSVNGTYSMNAPTYSFERADSVPAFGAMADDLPNVPSMDDGFSGQFQTSVGFAAFKDYDEANGGAYEGDVAHQVNDKLIDEYGDDDPGSYSALPAEAATMR